MCKPVRIWMRKAVFIRIEWQRTIARSGIAGRARSGKASGNALHVNREFAGKAVETDLHFVRVELIDDPAAIAEFGFEARREGDELICHRCGDARLSIAAILVVPAGGHTRWALCANCLLELP